MSDSGKNDNNNPSSDNRSISDKLKDEIIPSLFSSVVGIAGASIIMGVDLKSELSLFGRVVPTWAAVGGVILGADLIAYASHDFVLEKIPSIQEYANYENRILAPLLSGTGTYVLFAGLVSSNVALFNSFLLGAGSSVVGRYAYSTYSDQM
jgi:hypothetical protein